MDAQVGWLKAAFLAGATWILQAALLTVFATAYHYPQLRRLGLVGGA